MENLAYVASLKRHFGERHSFPRKPERHGIARFCRGRPLFPLFYFVIGLRRKGTRRQFLHGSRLRYWKSRQRKPRPWKEPIRPWGTACRATDPGHFVLLAAFAGPRGSFGGQAAACILPCHPSPAESRPEPLQCLRATTAPAATRRPPGSPPRLEQPPASVQEAHRGCRSRAVPT